MKLSEIASRIAAHLSRFEKDPAINVRDPVSKTSKYYLANAYASGWGRTTVS